jgi:hypothetical protein
MIKCPNRDNHDNGHHTTKIINRVKVVQVPRVERPQEIPQGYWNATTPYCYSVTKDYADECFDQTTNTIIQ